MKEKRIENWRILPQEGGGVCIKGTVNGVMTQSTEIKHARKGQVMTENSIYTLGAKSAGMWEVQLQMKRPVKYESLQAAGVL